MPETFGQWVKKEIEERKITANQLAVKVQMTPAALSRIINSQVGSSRKTVVKIADALKASRMEAIIYWLADDTQHGGAIYPATLEGGRVNLPDGGWYIPREGENPTWRRLIAETVASIELIKKGSSITVPMIGTDEEYQPVNSQK